MDDSRRCYTVWRFLSPSSGEVAISAKVSHPGDTRYQHEYQRVLWVGMADSRDAAVRAAVTGAAWLA